MPVLDCLLELEKHLGLGHCIGIPAIGTHSRRQSNPRFLQLGEVEIGVKLLEPTDAHIKLVILDGYDGLSVSLRLAGDLVAEGVRLDEVAIERGCDAIR